MALNKHRGRQKKRGFVKRKPSSIMLLSCEGNNVTEYYYLKGIYDNQSNIKVRKIKGGSTDPCNMVKDLIESEEAKNLDDENGDIAFCLTDIDQKDYKRQQIKQASSIIRKAKLDYPFEIICSNPCFEVWYLMHFEKRLRKFNDNNQVYDAVKEYIPDYNKSDKETYKQLIKLTNVAVQNSKSIKQDHLNSNNALRSKDCVPYTEVYKIFILKPLQDLAV